MTANKDWVEQTSRCYLTLAFQEHVANTGHAIDFSKFDILGRARTD